MNQWFFLSLRHNNRKINISLRQRKENEIFVCWRHHFLCSPWVPSRYRCSGRRNGSDESFIVNEIFSILKMTVKKLCQHFKNRIKEHIGRNGILLHMCDALFCVTILFIAFRRVAFMFSLSF